MHQRWTLHVENFGKIESADIEVSPMMLFVGDNNSGKSYLMSLLWELVAFDWNFTRDLELESYQKCEQWFKNNLHDGDNVIDDEIQTLLVNWFNDQLRLNKDDIVKNIFNHDVPIGEMVITEFKRNEPLILHKKDNCLNFIDYPYGLEITKEDGRPADISIETITPIICWYLLMKDFYPMPIMEKYSYRPIYLPASRTGFMLTYKTLIYHLIDTGFNSEFDFKKSRLSKSTLTLPIVRFLQDLVRLDFTNDVRYEQIASYLEKECLRGKVVKDGEQVPIFSFKPEGTREKMPLHITSSLVTELMPLVIFLKSDLQYKLLVIEEPEAHLHLEVQTVLAKALVRLLNSGLAIWLTTHSDTFFQQINNLIKLHNNPDNENLAREYGYSLEDFLDPSKVSAYQFDTNTNGTTNVERLKLKEGGFAVPTFNKAIFKLSKETVEFQGD